VLTVQFCSAVVVAFVSATAFLGVGCVRDAVV
jgi:hypothetical protein